MRSEKKRKTYNVNIKTAEAVKTMAIKENRTESVMADMLLQEAISKRNKRP